MSLVEVMRPARSPAAEARMRSRRGLRAVRRLGMAAACGGYLFVWGVAGLLPINPTDLDVFFLPSARLAAAGHPLAIYSVRYLGGYPNANGPLSLVPLTAVEALAGRLGWQDDASLRRMLAMAVFAIFSLLLAREALIATDRLRSVPLRGAARGLAYALILLSPALWHSVLFYGHVEQPLMLVLVLAAVRALASRRVWLAGLLLGLALLTRSAVVVLALPLVLLLARHRRWRDVLRLAAAMAGVVALGLLPFWLSNRDELVFSLAGFRAQLPVGGGTLWRLTVGTPLLGIAQRWDGVAVLVAAALVCALTLWRRPELDVGSRDLYALLALCALCFPLGIKTLWPYYFLDPYVLLAIWWLAHPYRQVAGRGWRWWLGLAGPTAAVVCAQLAEAGVQRSGNGVWDVPSSLVTSAAMLGLAAGVALVLWRTGETVPRLAASGGV